MYFRILHLRGRGCRGLAGYLSFLLSFASPTSQEGGCFLFAFSLAWYEPNFKGRWCAGERTWEIRSCVVVDSVAWVDGASKDRRKPKKLISGASISGRQAGVAFPSFSSRLRYFPFLPFPLFLFSRFSFSRCLAFARAWEGWLWFLIFISSYQSSFSRALGRRRYILCVV